jgi:hypothetical protein
MAFGTLKADTLTHSTAGSLATNYVVNGSSKHWLDYKGTSTNAIRDSLNCSSVTDSGTGLYEPAFSSSMATINYAHPSCGSQGEILIGNTAAPQTGKYYIAGGNSSFGAYNDQVYMHTIAMGDLA